MGDFKFFKVVFALMILFFLYSCNKENNNEVFIELNKLSSEIYIKETDDLRRFFESKSIEEPEKYRITFEKIIAIENKIKDYKSLKTIANKKKFINEFKSLVEIEGAQFVCQKMDTKDLVLFNSVIENDLNRVLYKTYKKFYTYHHSVF
ncbi:hypothetical protein [Aquimarina algiphila]|uniref:hypothetical protein n=1 Tax=Aquimarina algiphila TaxID=2047982 RepID=UPI0024916D83|nr:hypothetical protein [Aquimarina algiphila]